LAASCVTNKKAELSQRWPRDAPNICGCSENFGSPWLRLLPTATFPELFNRLLLRLSL